MSVRDVRGKLREWVSTEQHGPVKQKVREGSCSDVRMCIPTKKKKKTLLKEHALISVDLLLPKK